MAAAGRIDERRLEYARTDHFDSVARSGQSVDPDHVHGPTAGSVSGGLPGSQGHLVVVGEHQIDLRIDPVERIGAHFGVGTQPMGILAAKHPDTGMVFQRIDETLMTVDGRRRSAQSGQLDHLAPAAELGGDVFSDDLSDPVVVRPDIGRVVVGENLAVHDDYRNPPSIGLFDYGSHRNRFVRCDDQQIDALFDKVAYVGDLPFAVASGRPDFEFQVVVQQSLGLHFVVHLLPPGIVAALGDADREMRSGGVTGRQQESGEQQKSFHGAIGQRIREIRLSGSAGMAPGCVQT